MANVYLEASAAVGTSGGQTKGARITFSGSGAVGTVGTIELKTGGAAGTTVWKVFVDGGHPGQLDLPANMAFDYVTIANAVLLLEYYKPHGVVSSI